MQAHVLTLALTTPIVPIVTFILTHSNLILNTLEAKIVLMIREPSASKTRRRKLTRMHD